MAYPLGALLLGAGVFTVTLMLLVAVSNALQTLGVDRHALMAPLATGHYLFASYLLVPLTSALFCYIGYSHRSRWYWPLLTAVVLAVAGGIFLGLNLTMPLNGQSGMNEYNVTFDISRGIHLRSWWRLVSPVLVFAAFALWWRRVERGAAVVSS